MEKATQFIQKQKEKILETVGINPKIKPDTRLEAIKAKLQKLEAIVDVLRKNFVRHAKCVREMTESAYLIAQDVQQFYQKDESRADIVKQFTDSHLDIESVSRELFHSQFNEVAGILQMFDDWLDQMAIFKHDLASAEQTRKDALLLGAKVKSLREERKKAQLKGGNSRWPQIGNKTPENAAEADQMIQAMTQDYEKLVQKFRDDRKELETNVQTLVQKRFGTFDECLFRLMECQVEFYRHGAAFSDSFSPHIEKYRETCPRGPSRSSGNNIRRKQPPPPPGTPPINHRKSPGPTAGDEDDVPESAAGGYHHAHSDDDHEEDHVGHEETDDHDDHYDNATTDVTTDHSDYGEDTDEEGKDEHIVQPQTRQRRLPSVEDFLDMGAFHSAVGSKSSNGSRGGGSTTSADIHESFGELNLMDSNTGADDLNPVHEIPPALHHNAFHHDPIDHIFGQRTPTGSRHSVDIGDLKRSNGDFMGGGSSRGYQPSTYPSKRESKPHGGSKKPRNEFDPVFENEPQTKFKSKNQFNRDDFLFDDHDVLSSGSLAASKGRKKSPPKSAPQISKQKNSRTPITNVAQHRREKKEELKSKIAKNQATALAEKRNNEVTNQKLRDEKEQHASELQYKLDTWEYKNGVRRNIRTLLSSIHAVLWDDSGWKQVSLAAVTRPKDVKIQYYKVLLVIHPDKCSDKDSRQQAIAERLFQAMNTAWAEFQASQK